MSDHGHDIVDWCAWCGVYCGPMDDRVRLGLVAGQPGGPPAKFVAACSTQHFSYIERAYAAWHHAVQPTAEEH